MCLLDHLVGNGKYGWRHLDAECSRGLHVDDELEFGRLQHRQVSGLGAFEDIAGIDADLTKGVSEVGSVTHQPAGFHRLTDRVSRWNLVPRRQSGKLHTATDQEGIASDEQNIEALARKCGKGCIDLADRTGVEDLDLQPHGGSGLLYLAHRGLDDCGIAWIDQHGNTNGLGHHLMQEPEPLGHRLLDEKIDACHVAAWETPDVRFTPESVIKCDIMECPLWANSGHH